MSAVELFRSLFEQASAQGSRTTAVAPIGWALATVLAALTGTSFTNVNPWIPVVLAIFASLLLILYVGAYIYFMLKSPDSLRSERFTLSKMALEKSVKGDNLGGFVDVLPNEVRSLEIEGPVG
jgi:hypothetical protein